MFLVAVVCKILNQQPSKANMHFFWYFVVDKFNCPNNGMASPHAPPPPLASTLASPLPLRQLLGWLSCWIIKRQPPKAKATLVALFFDGVCVSAPNKGTCSHECKPASRRLRQTHSKPLCLDLRPWQMLQWQKMAKPLEGRAVVAHVGCCVFCVFCVLCCVLAAF